MLDIQVFKKTSKEILEFSNKEWKQADIEHYGKVIDWKKEKKVVEARENGELIGVLEITIQAGVMLIEDLIVKHSKQGQGAGKALMQKAEEIAKDKEVHKIYLETGANWRSGEFYKGLGFTKSGDLPKHSAGFDYVIYSKYL